MLLLLFFVVCQIVIFFRHHKIIPFSSYDAKNTGVTHIFFVFILNWSEFYGVFF